MDAQTFLDNFATIAEAPGGVDRLRNLVLGLAASGRLSEALPGDRTPSIPGLALAPERPSLLPRHWIWAELGTIGPPGERATADGPFGSKLKTSDYVDQPGFRVLRLGNIGVRTFKDADRSYIAEAHFADLAGYHLRSGDVLVASLGSPCGRACLVPDHALPAINKADCFRIRPHEDVNPAFLVIALNSPAALARAADLNRGDTRGRITLSHLKQSPVPLPPLAEQERIVAKVDELMGLCDDLEAHQERRHRATTHFRSSALHALAEAESTENFRLAWQRVESNWPAITAASDSIGELRQTVLQLAFEGRLTGAGAHGRPRSESTPPILDGPFPIPGHWRWARFDEVADSRLGKMLDKAKNTGPLRPYLRNANVQWFRFDLSDVHELRLEDADLETHSLRAGDLVICEGGEPGRLAVCDDIVSGMVFQKALHRARPRSDVDVWYLAFLLRCYAGSGYLSTFFTGATIKHLTGKALASVPVPVPPIAEQRQIVARIEELTTACDQLEATTSRCAAIQAAAAAGLTRAT